MRRSIVRFFFWVSSEEARQAWGNKWTNKITMGVPFTASKRLNFPEDSTLEKRRGIKGEDRILERRRFCRREMQFAAAPRSSLSSSRQIDRVKIQLALAVNCMILVDSIHLLIRVLSHMLLAVRVWLRELAFRVYLVTFRTSKCCACMCGIPYDHMRWLREHA